jgi:hypothetical protein
MQYATGRRVVAVLLTIVLVGMLMSMSHRLYDGKDVEAINELLSVNHLTGGRQKCSLVAAPVASEGDFARFFPTDAHLIQKSIDQMDDAEMLQYLHWSDRASCHLSYDFSGVHVINNGTTGIDGQKVVCMDHGVGPTPGKCLVYSIGIANDWSFDKLMERYGCEVYAMDERGWKSRTVATIYEVLFNNISIFVTI